MCLGERYKSLDVAIILSCEERSPRVPRDHVTFRTKNITEISVAANTTIRVSDQPASL